MQSVTVTHDLLWLICDKITVHFLRTKQFIDRSVEVYFFWTTIYHYGLVTVQTRRRKTDRVGSNPFTADPVKALQFAILV